MAWFLHLSWRLAVLFLLLLDERVHHGFIVITQFSKLALVAARTFIDADTLAEPE